MMCFWMLLAELFCSLPLSRSALVAPSLRLPNIHTYKTINTIDYSSTNSWNTHTHTQKLTNIEPDNGPLEKETPFGNHCFQVPCYISGGYNTKSPTAIQLHLSGALNVLVFSSLTSSVPLLKQVGWVQLHSTNTRHAALHERETETNKTKQVEKALDIR